MDTTAATTVSEVTNWLIYLWEARLQGSIPMVIRKSQSVSGASFEVVSSSQPNGENLRNAQIALEVFDMSNDSLEGDFLLLFLNDLPKRFTRHCPVDDIDLEGEIGFAECVFHVAHRAQVEGFCSENGQIKIGGLLRHSLGA